MRFILLLTIVLLYSCESKKESIAKKQQAVKEEMEQVKALYYKKSDSLKSVMEADTDPAKQSKIAEQISSADRQRLGALLKLQKESDSLELELKNH